MADANLSAPSVLEQWLDHRLSSEAKNWLEEKRRSLQEDRDCYLAFALVPRKAGKADLNLTEDELKTASALCPGWRPVGWTIDQATRILLLLSGPKERFTTRLDTLCATGDIGELVTLYQALPLYPDPPGLTKRAAEGVRTNIVPVFEAVAHFNPYPKTYFDEAAWNQMVLKALFIGSSLHPIQGLDERANEPLALTLIDYAHERWAAHRPVSPELWRCVGPFLKENWLPDVQRVWNSGEPMAKEAAGLALAASGLPGARAVLESDAQLARAINSGEISWRRIHENLTAA